MDNLSKLNLAIPYNKLIMIETEIANFVYEKVENNNDIYIPPNINHGINLHLQQIAQIFTAILLMENLNSMELPLKFFQRTKEKQIKATYMLNTH